MQPTDQVTPAQPRKVSGRTQAALWLMIGPTALFFVSFFGFAIANWLLLGNSIPDQDPSQNPNLFNKPSYPVATTVVNVTLFITTAIAFITWLPGLITGIVLLATRKPSQHA